MTSKLVSIINGRPMTTSVIVSEYFQKRHANVLRSIQALECSEEFGRLNFEQSSYKNAQNKEQPCYKITKDGFMFLAMGFTGKEAAIWKEKFISLFNEMEAKLREPDANKTALEVLRGKTLRMNVEYNGQLSFSVEEPKDYYAEFAKAIRDPSNIGLTDDTIRMVADACLESLTRRAKSRKEWGAALNKRLNEVDPARKQLKRL